MSFLISTLAQGAADMVNVTFGTNAMISDAKIVSYVNEAALAIFGEIGAVEVIEDPPTKTITLVQGTKEYNLSNGTDYIGQKLVEILDVYFFYSGETKLNKLTLTDSNKYEDYSDGEESIPAMFYIKEVDSQLHPLKIGFLPTPSTEAAAGGIVIRRKVYPTVYTSVNSYVQCPDFCHIAFQKYLQFKLANAGREYPLADKREQEFKMALSKVKHKYRRLHEKVSLHPDVPRISRVDSKYREVYGN